jgi:hypothetical protein
MFYFEPFLLYNINEDNYINIIIDNFRISEDLSNASLENHASSSPSERSSSSYSFTSEDAHCFNVMDKYKAATARIFDKLKNNINNKTEYVTQKIKVFDRTLS